MRVSQRIEIYILNFHSPLFRLFHSPVHSGITHVEMLADLGLVFAFCYRCLPEHCHALLHDIEPPANSMRKDLVIRTSHLHINKRVAN